MRTSIIAVLVLAGSAAFGQTFEVASVKPAAPQTEGRFAVRMGGDPGLVDYKNVSLRDLIREAYAVKDYQVTGPDWLNSARFDVQAKMPPDTTREARNLMMQALLAERFQLKVHKESKEIPMYGLVVGKNGPKLKPAEDGPAPADRSSAPPPPPPPGVPGDRRLVPKGAMMMRIQDGGRMHLTAKGISVTAFAEMLGGPAGKPVFDNTGIPGLYDIDVEFKSENAGGMMRGMPMPMPRPEGGGAAGAGGAVGSAAGGPAPESVEAPSIFTALQDQLGLKLEPKKGPIETIVIDHAEKVPTEN